MRSPLTEVQQRIYTFIIEFIRENKYSPTIREIQTHFEYGSSNSVVSHLRKLKEKGYITSASSKDGMKARTIRLVDDLISVHMVSSEDITKAIKNLKARDYKLEMNVAIEFLSALKIGIT